MEIILRIINFIVSLIAIIGGVKHFTEVSDSTQIIYSLEYGYLIAFGLILMVTDLAKIEYFQQRCSFLCTSGGRAFSFSVVGFFVLGPIGFENIAGITTLILSAITFSFGIMGIEYPTPK
jgi:hypothetical protein